MTRSILCAAFVAAALAANAPGVAFADEAPAAPARVYHVPPAEAAPGVALAIDATIDHAWQANLELRYRAVGGDPAFHAVAFERTSGDDYRASVPANVVAPPGVEYFIASTDGKGAVTLHFASAANPHRVAVHEDEGVVLRARELGRYQGRQARAHVAIENVDFGSRTVNGKQLDDRYLRVDADFTYRLLRLPLHSLRFGYTYLLGDTPATPRGDGICDPVKEDPPAGSCTGQAGFKAAGWFELRLRANALVDVDLRGILAATKKGFSMGGRGELRIGSEMGSHVALGAEVLADAGSTGFLRLGWDTVPHFPMAATIELSSLPSSHRATAVRLVYDVAYPLDGGLRLGLRARYQARDSSIGGLTLGANVALDF